MPKHPRDLVWIVCFLFVSSIPSAVSASKSNVAVVGGGGTRMPNRILFPREDAEEEDSYCQEIRLILNKRLEMVLDGKREDQFQQHYKKNKRMMDRGQTIVSSHGRSEIEKEEIEKEEIQIEEEEEEEEGENVFPSDMISLDILLESPIPAGLVENDGDPSLASIMLRGTRLCWNFAPCISTAGLAWLSSSYRNIWYKMLSKSLARSGPAFIKWGQWASTRSDMFAEELCVALSALQADAPSHSWRFTKKAVTNSLRIPPDSLPKIFQSFDRTPLASGSIAQIHRAVLLPHHHRKINTPIAVKVRHPRVSRLISMDFRIMAFLADIADSVPSLKWINIRSSVEQFSHTMADQAHLDVEAHHLELLNHNFRKWEHVGFPRPLFATKEVIFETFEKGRIVTAVMDHYDRLSYKLSSPIEKEDAKMPLQMKKFLVGNGLNVYLKMLLVDNLMHADLHPGNIMLDILHAEDHTPTKPLLLGGAQKHKHHLPNPISALTKTHTHNHFHGHLTIVDAGMVAYLNKEESINFIGMFSSLGTGDGCAAATAILRFSPYNARLTQKQQAAFTRDMIVLFKKSCRGYHTDVHVGEVLRGALTVVRTHQVRIDANYATLIVNALCVEGMARRVCPEYNILDASKPLMKSYKRICKDGSCHRNRMRLKAMRSFMPLLLWKKNFSDYLFFQNLEKSINATDSSHISTAKRIKKILVTATILAITAATSVSVRMVRSDPRPENDRPQPTRPLLKQTGMGSDYKNLKSHMVGRSQMM